MGETGFILAKMPEPEDGNDIKERLKDSSAFVYEKFGDLIGKNLFDVALEYIEDLEQKLFLKPLSWDEAMGDDAFLEIKGDEYNDAALNIFACGYDGEIHEDDHILYITHGEDSLKLMGTDYGKTWRCWARRPTDEERAAAVWEAE